MLPDRLNFRIFSFLTLAHLYLLGILPVLLNQCDSPTKLTFLRLSIIPFFFINNLLWSLIHEGIHWRLFSIRLPDLNLWGSRLLSLLFGSSYQFLRVAHLSHHRFNRTETERVEVRDGFGFLYYFQLCGGLYLVEAVTPLVLLLPRELLSYFFKRDGKSPQTMADKIFHFLEVHPETLAGVRFEAVLLLVFWSGVISLYGRHWLVLLVILAVRAFMVSVHDYAYHYAGPLDDVKSAYSLSMPESLSRWLLLNFNYHRVHHLWPHLPWTELRRTFLKQGMSFDKSLARGVMLQFQGTIPLSQWRADK